jgi:hypothetical protein
MARPVAIGLWFVAAPSAAARIGVIPRPCPAGTGVVTGTATAAALVGTRRHRPAGTGVITRAATAAALVGTRRHGPPGTGVITRAAATAAARLRARPHPPATGAGLIVRLRWPLRRPPARPAGPAGLRAATTARRETARISGHAAATRRGAARAPAGDVGPAARIAHHGGTVGR